MDMVEAECNITALASVVASSLSLVLGHIISIFGRSQIERMGVHLFSEAQLVHLSGSEYRECVMT